MARHHFYSYVQDGDGIKIGEARINIFKANSTTPATVYTAESSGSVLNATPQRTSDTAGYFEFWIDDVVYNRFQKFKIEALTATYSSSIDYLTIARTSDGWKTISDDYTAKSGDRISAKTNDNSFTITLPSSPVFGNSVRVADSTGNFESSNLIVSRNSEKMKGAELNATLITNWDDKEFVYINATIGWRY